jgi:hypothetical protein
MEGQTSHAAARDPGTHAHVVGRDSTLMVAVRREAGSRWLDGGMPLHAVRDLLGHSNVSQTSTYLSTTSASLHDAMSRFEALQQVATGAGTKFSSPNCRIIEAAPSATGICSRGNRPVSTSGVARATSAPHYARRGEALGVHRRSEGKVLLVDVEAAKDRLPVRGNRARDLVAHD